MTIIVLCIVAVVGGLWVFGYSMSKTLQRMENQSEDAYWMLKEMEDYLDEVEIEEDEEEPLTL